MTTEIIIFVLFSVILSTFVATHKMSECEKKDPCIENSDYYTEEDKAEMERIMRDKDKSKWEDEEL